MVTYQNIAGQLVPGGTGPYGPVAALEMNHVVGENLATINSLAVKISSVMIEETRIFGDPFGGMIRMVDDPFGAGVEMAGFIGGAANKKIEPNRCAPYGNVQMTAQVAYTNWGYNIPITLFDREINKVVLSAEEASKFYSEKAATALKTAASMRYRSWLQMFANVVDGTREITGTYDRSDGSATVGTPVTYNMEDIKGYAGMVGTPDIVVPAPVAGTLSEIADEDALTFALELEGIVADMAFESTDFNRLGIDTFVRGRPYLIAEKKTLNALDAAFTVNAGYKGFPTVSARQFLGGFSDIIEVDKFPDIPTNANYTGKRLAAVLIDRDGVRQINKYADVEAQRCAEPRSTTYSYQAEAIFAIYKGVPSYAMLVNPSAEEE